MEVVKVKTDNNSKVYIKEEDKQKCMRSHDKKVNEQAVM